MPAAEKEKEFKYTVDDLVEATGLQKPSIRIGLRESTFKKTGSIWGWNTKTDFDAVVKFFKDRSSRRPDTTKKDAKPAAKAADAKPTRKPKEEPAPAPTRRRKAAA